MTDFIGDIHGHADKLEELLQILGYKKQSDTYLALSFAFMLERRFHSL